jgi:hypothetical protein
MDGATRSWKLSEVEKEQNVLEYGESYPWECVDDQPVYQVLLQGDLGREIRLTVKKTYKNTHTDEFVECIRPWGEVKFVFDDEWPENDVFDNGIITYRPCAGTCSMF